MQGTILLNHNENTRQVEEEEKSRFLRGILEQCFESTDIADQIRSIWRVDGPLPAEQKVQLRNLLATYKIQIIDDFDGLLQVYLENDLIGEFNKPTYKLKQDLRVIDPRKRIYLEMKIDCWSLFDQQEEQET